jgi:hypothetical protein
MPLSGGSYEPLSNACADEHPQAQTALSRPLCRLIEEPFLVEPRPCPGDREQVWLMFRNSVILGLENGQATVQPEVYWRSSSQSQRNVQYVGFVSLGIRSPSGV